MKIVTPGKIINKNKTIFQFNNSDSKIKIINITQFACLFYLKFLNEILLIN